MLQYSCHTFLHSAFSGGLKQVFLKSLFGKCQFVYTEVTSSIMATFEMAKNYKWILFAISSFAIIKEISSDL